MASTSHTKCRFRSSSTKHHILLICMGHTAPTCLKYQKCQIRADTPYVQAQNTRTSPHYSATRRINQASQQGARQSGGGARNTFTHRETREQASHPEHGVSETQNIHTTNFSKEHNNNTQASSIRNATRSEPENMKTDRDEQHCMTIHPTTRNTITHTNKDNKKNKQCKKQNEAE